MAPSAPVVAALFRLAAAWDDENSMLQMPELKKVDDTLASDCACPGFYEDSCRANAFQGCVWTKDDLGLHPQGWTDQGASNAPWCQCDPNFVKPDGPLFPTPEPAPVLTCPVGWEQKGTLGADIGGCGLQSCDERYDLTSEVECAARCSTTWGCVGFSWAPMNGDRNHPGVTACTIYNSDAPTGLWTGTDGEYSQLFCGRSFWARLGEDAQGVNSCATETIPEENCWEAGQTLIAGIGSSNMQELHVGSWTHVPPGCNVRRSNYNILWNNNANGANDGDWIPICSHE